ncbi:Spy0128 family protein [Caniella muris]|uniref:Spy0128 family protein n=1 Tax=Caniella muris TaxID=2941502 RepID=UPI00203B3E24|nr:FctA domain-containing protein [Caniella muris]
MRPTPKNGTLKRFVTFALSLVLVFTSFPVTAPAYGDGVEGEVLEVVSVDGDAAPDAQEGDGAEDAAAADGLAQEPPAEEPDAEAAPAEQTLEPEAGPAAEPGPDAEPAAEPEPANGAAREANQPSRTVDGTVTEDLTYNKAGDYTLTVNGTLKGRIVISGGAKVTIVGPGTIDGTGKDASVIEVTGAGSRLVFDGPTVKGGSGSSLGAQGLKDLGSGYDKAGGGILVRRDNGEDTGAALEFRGGTVTGNTAKVGGGIFIDRTCGLTMTSGTVSSNTATTHEGGGIYVAGNHDGAGAGSYARIDGGSIVDNRTQTKVDWGGGGIFVESKGVLFLGSALITKNTANGLGGGISGCPHASIGIGRIEEGFSLYGNTARRQSWPDNKYLDSLEVTYNGKTYEAGDKWAKADPGFTAAKAMDYYCVNVSYINGYDGHANSTVAWTGRAAGSTAYGTQARDVTVYKGDSLVLPGESLGLTSTKPASDTVTGRAVTITGNTSTTHGGGIGCNGTLMVGELPNGDQYSPLSFEIRKEFENSDGQAVGLKGGEFAFDLVDASGKTVATSRNDENGAVLFSVDMEGVLKTQIAAGQTKDVTYTVREQRTDGDDRDIEYAEDVTVTLSVRHRVQSISYPNASLNVTYHDPELKGIEVDGKAFDNGAASGNPVTMANTLRLRRSVLFGTVGFEAEKSLVNALGKDMELGGRTFEFTLTGIDGTVVENADGTTTAMPDGSVTVGNDADGTIVFEGLGIASYLQGLPWDKDGETHTVPVELKLREVVPDDKGDIAYDEAEHTVRFTVDATAEVAVDNAAGTKTVTVTPVIRQGTLTVDDKAIEAAPIVNTHSLVGEWAPTATKHFMGSGDSAPYTFTLRELAQAPAEGQDISEVPVKDGRTWTGTTGDYVGGTATVTFDAVDFRVDGTADDKRNDLGDHWFVMTEDGGDEPGRDPVAYVLQVRVSEDDSDRAGLKAEVVGTWFAGSVDGPLVGEDTAPVFYNTDGESGIAFANYAVYAASGAPADATCLVDPKIVKELDGRTIRPGEFSFKLVTVNGPHDDDLSGTVVSATSNDRYGMVDFDAANPQGWDYDGNPVCLVFNSAGSYWYRVVEDEGMSHDPTVDYSDEVILFHVEVEHDDQTGTLQGTYEYGHLVDGEYVAYPESVGNPTWHPTMTNRVRDIDLRVRKTSVLDRDLGLEGATYGLYLVNDEGGHDDVLLGEATSDEDGWLLFEDVRLSSGSRYYFQEVSAPGGHTVSEFRSPYFSVAADGSAPGGLTLVRAEDPAYDTEAGPAAQAEEIADEPVALAEGADGGATSQEQPDGSTLLTYSFDGGVYDEATRVAFNKLDTRTREWVVGAKLQILREDDGEVVASWTSGEATKELVATLDVDVSYILREVEAPEGYHKAGDVVFTIDPYGKVSLVSGADNGNAEISAETITLFDTQVDAEEVVPLERVTERRVGGDRGTGGTESRGGSVPATGDLASNGWVLAGLAALVAVAVTGAVVLHRRRG